MTTDSNPPSDSTASPQAEDAEMPEKTATSMEGAPSDPISHLQANLEAAKAESEQWRDRFLRKAAEMENYRKRSDRERAEASTQVKSSTLIEFLPILDACERALDSFKENNDGHDLVNKYREGVELLYKQLGNTLNRLGVVPLEAKGSKFDPNLHEALTHLETQEFEDNTVIEELRRGYLFKNRLLRPAQVVVASRPKPKESGSASK
jgi:molecular chaperone GrpE